MSFFLDLLQLLFGGESSSPEPPRSSSSQTLHSLQSSSSNPTQSSSSKTCQSFQNSSSSMPSQSSSSQIWQSLQSPSLSKPSQTWQSPQSSSSITSQSSSFQTWQSLQSSSSSMPSQSSSSQIWQSVQSSSSSIPSQTWKSIQSSSSISSQSSSSQTWQSLHSSSSIPSQSSSSQTWKSPQSSSSIPSQTWQSPKSSSSIPSQTWQSPQSSSSKPSHSSSSQTWQSPQSSPSIPSQSSSSQTWKSPQSSSSIPSQSSSSQTWQSPQSSSSIPSQTWKSLQSSSSIPSQSSSSQTWSSLQSSSSILPSTSSFKVPQTSTQPSPSSPFSFNGPLSPSPSPFSSSSSPFSQKLPNLKPILHESPSNATDQKGKKKANYIWVEKDSLPIPVIPKAPTSSSEPTQSSSYQTWPSSPQSSSPNPSPPSSPFSFNGPPSPSPRKLPTFKPTLREAPPNATYQKGKANYIWVEKGSQPLYMVPEVNKDLMKKEIVPEILKKPLSPLTYKDYFSTLLYAEEYYFEKWNKFEMKNVTLELQKAEISKRRNKHKHINENDEQEDRIFVEFKIDSVPENRPFLLSRDFVYARPSGSGEDPFEGVIFRVEGRKNLVLAEFEDEFYLQHDSAETYDISFSFNRICLKRAHQALDSVSDNLFHNFLFPDSVSLQMNILTSPASDSHFLKHDHADISSTVSQILSIQGSPPYLVSGPLCVPERKAFSHSNEPSKTGKVVQEAVFQIHKSSPECRILISAPSNSACDVLMRSLKKVIPESHMFRANAAFREKDEVPDDILSSCLYKEEYFACPSLKELRKFRVIFSTFMSSFRLHNEGIAAGHFSHIFLVDASFAIEPEALVTLANFADENTAIVVTGRPGNSSSWVRSEIGRKMGLKISYFERLCQRWPYKTRNPKFFADLGLEG